MQAYKFADGHGNAEKPKGGTGNNGGSLCIDE
jgi:hypothetical protein